MVTETQRHEMTEEDEWEEMDPSTSHDVAEGGMLGAVGGAIVGALAGGPIGAVIGAVLGGIASAGAVDLVDKHDHEAAASAPHRSTLIRVRAYAIYEQRGRADGRDVEDWLKAEHEIFP